MAALASAHLKGMARDEFKVQEGLGTVPSVVAAMALAPDDRGSRGKGEITPTPVLWL